MDLRQVDAIIYFLSPSFLRLPDGDDGNMNKPGSLPDLTNFHVTGSAGGHADSSPPVIGGGAVGSPMIGGAGSAGPHQFSIGPPGDDMGSPYSSVS